jgi:hypothetical protein
LYPLLAVAAVPLVACISTNSAAGGEHINVFVNCFCSDVVGGELCTTLKQKVGALSGYRLADQPLGAGVGVHLACRDTGAAVKGAQSAVSVAYTVYLESPNEVFVALAVMLVGTHRVEPTAAAIVSTVRRIAGDNASTFKQLGPTGIEDVHQPVEVYEVPGLGPVRTRLQRWQDDG